MMMPNTPFHLSGIVGIGNVSYAPLVCHPSDIP
jgi:hypothetical protein